MTKFKHLDAEKRWHIEHGLRNHASFKQLARELDVAPSTIKREVFERAQESLKGAALRVTNRCIHRTHCKEVQLCKEQPNCLRKCSLCRLCNKVCEKFREELCPRLAKAPYVCNGCEKERMCTLRKVFYIASAAEKEARTMLVESRRGANISEEELRRIEKCLANGIGKGQSIHHILTHHRDELTVSDKTVYRYIDANLVSVRNGDLPRKPYIKPRKDSTKQLTHKVDTKCRIGRTIEDYDNVCENEGPFPRILMDTVIGRVGGKVLLTLHFCESNLMLGRLMPNKTSAAVIEAFNDLQNRLGLDAFRILFPIILTDNGTEFSNPTRLENTPEGDPRTRIFYCDTYNSNQKAEIERNHELLRCILPKGSSFDNFTQADIDLALSHINSYTRPKFNDRIPYHLFAAHYGPEILDRLNQTLITPDAITLKPALLKRS